VVEAEKTVDVITSPTASSDVKRALEEAGFSASYSEISMEPSTTVALTGSEAERMLRLADSLEDLDDVQNFYANFDISEEVMAEFA